MTCSFTTMFISKFLFSKPNWGKLGFLNLNVYVVNYYVNIFNHILVTLIHSFIDIFYPSKGQRTEIIMSLSLTFSIILLGSCKASFLFSLVLLIPFIYICLLPFSSLSKKENLNKYDNFYMFLPQLHRCYLCIISSFV